MVGIRIVDGETHLLFQTTCSAHIVGLIQFVFLQEGKDIVVEDADNPQCHRVEANGIEINGGLIHIGNDDTVISPTHLGQIVGQVEWELIFALQHHSVFGTNATADRHVHVLQLITIQVRLVEIEVNLISLNVSLIANFLIEIDKTRKVLVLLQRLREKQRAFAGRLVNIKQHRLKGILGIDGQAAFHLGFAVQRFAVEDDRNLIIRIFTLEFLQFKVIDIVADIGNLNRMALAERLIKQIDDLVLVDGHGKGQTDEVIHLFI